MPWKPGQSGNPNGSRRRLTTSYEQVQRCLKRLGGRHGEHWAAELHSIAMGRQYDTQARLKAFALLVPYLWGRPPERVEVSGGLSHAVRVVHEYHDPAGGVVQAERVIDLLPPAESSE